MNISIAAALLKSLLSAVLPVAGVSIGDPLDKSTWRVDWAQTPTVAEETLAASTIATFDVTNQATIDSEQTDLAKGTSRHRDKLADIAWAIRRSNVNAWTAMTPLQKRNTVLTEADNWRDIRVWIEKNW